MASPSRPNRGYPVEIFGSSEVNEKFLCTVCHLVLRNAVQRYCGHRYCKDCVDAAAETGCSACEREGQEEQPPDETLPQALFHFYYRAMHFSAKRGIAIACRLSVRPSVCLSVCL